MKRSISAILVSLAFLCIIFAAFACSEPGGPDESGTAAPDGPDAGDREEIPDGLAEKDWGGRKFRILHRDNGLGCRHVEEIYSEAIIGEIVNDAIYSRNMAVERRFNIEIEPIPVACATEQEVTEHVEKSVKADDDSFDLVVHGITYSSVLATNGYLVNWYSVPNISFSKPWWVQSAVEEMSVGDAAFLAMSDMNLSAMDTSCLYFNKKLLTQYQIEYPYQAVLEGSWTIDHFAGLVKGIYQDLDHDGKEGERDFYGFATTAFGVSWLWAFDQPIMKRDENGIPEMVLNTPKTVSIVEKLYSLFYETPGVYCHNNIYREDGSLYYLVAADIFLNERALFATGVIGNSADLYRGAEDFGIVPYFKWDENQKNYYSMLDTHTSIMMIPTTASGNLDFIGTMTEALSAEGYRQIVPAYYETALKIKYARDDESVAMLDLIMAGRRFDFGYIYDGGQGMGLMLQALMADKSKNFASYYEKNEKAAMKHYQTIIDYYLENAG